MSVHTSFLDALTPSAIRAITARMRDKKRDGVNVVNFAGGMPDEATFPAAEFAAITAEILRDEGGAALQYAASDGYDPLRASIAELMRKVGVETDFRHIVITCGSQQALSYLTRALVEPGDVVVCEAPSYVGALDTFRTQQARVVGVEMDEDGMRMDVLEAILRETRPRFIYTIPDFQNPTGRCMSLERRKQLVALAEQYDTYIIEDAPYSLIRFSGSGRPAVKSFDTTDRVIYLGSFSKTICPGIRIGWIHADAHTLQQIIYLKMRDDLQVCNLAQRLADGYLRRYDFDAHLKDVSERYRRRRDQMLQAIEDSFPRDCHVVVPKGGIFLWVYLPERLDAQTVFDVVFEHDLAFVPGTFFYPDRSEKNTMRLNFCTNDEAVIAQEIRRMGSIISDLAQM